MISKQQQNKQLKTYLLAQEKKIMSRMEQYLDCISKNFPNNFKSIYHIQTQLSVQQKHQLQIQQRNQYSQYNTYTQVACIKDYTETQTQSLPPNNINQIFRAYQIKIKPASEQSNRKRSTDTLFDKQSTNTVIYKQEKTQSQQNNQEDQLLSHKFYEMMEDSKDKIKNEQKGELIDIDTNTDIPQYLNTDINTEYKQTEDKNIETTFILVKQQEFSQLQEKYQKACNQLELEIFQKSKLEKSYQILEQKYSVQIVRQQKLQLIFDQHKNCELCISKLKQENQKLLQFKEEYSYAYEHIVRQYGILETAFQKNKKSSSSQQNIRTLKEIEDDFTSDHLKKFISSFDYKLTEIFKKQHQNYQIINSTDKQMLQLLSFSEKVFNKCFTLLKSSEQANKRLQQKNVSIKKYYGEFIEKFVKRSKQQKQHQQNQFNQSISAILKMKAQEKKQQTQSDIKSNSQKSRQRSITSSFKTSNIESQFSTSPRKDNFHHINHEIMTSLQQKIKMYENKIHELEQKSLKWQQNYKRLIIQNKFKQQKIMKDFNQFMSVITIQIETKKKFVKNLAKQIDQITSFIPTSQSQSIYFMPESENEIISLLIELKIFCKNYSKLKDQSENQIIRVQNNFLKILEKLIQDYDIKQFQLINLLKQHNAFINLKNLIHKSYIKNAQKQKDNKPPDIAYENEN